MRLLLSLAAAAVLLAGCGSDACKRTCAKLKSCGAVTDELQCVKDCETPPNGGRTCSNEDAIATCFEAATCADLTSESSRLTCPSCQ
jgi:hypothetical protein